MTYAPSSSLTNCLLLLLLTTTTFEEALCINSNDVTRDGNTNKVYRRCTLKTVIQFTAFNMILNMVARFTKSNKKLYKWYHNLPWIRSFPFFAFASFVFSCYFKFSFFFFFSFLQRFLMLVLNVIFPSLPILYSTQLNVRTIPFDH